MRNTWDRFAKEVLPTVLAGVGRIDTAVEAQVDAQQIDVVVTPEPGIDWEAAFERIGWVARMAERPAIIEPYSTTVGLEDVRDCIRRQLTLHHMRKKAAEKQPDAASASPLEVPRLWLLSAGDARAATEAFGLTGQAGWPAGFRFATPGHELCVVVLSELPKTRATLSLRLLGRGPTLADAVQETRQLPETDPLRRPLDEVLAQRRFAALDSTDDEDLAEAEMLQQEWQKFKDQIREEGREDGRKEGRKEGREEGIRTTIEALCEVLGIELTPARRSVIVAMNASELTPLLEILKQHRRWPEH